MSESNDNVTNDNASNDNSSNDNSSNDNSSNDNASSNNSSNNASNDNASSNNSSNNASNVSNASNDTVSNASNDTVSNDNASSNNASSNNASNNASTNVSNASSNSSNSSTNASHKSDSIIYINETINEPGIKIHNLQEALPGVNVITNSTMETTTPENNPQINQDLEQTITYKYDNSASLSLMNQIKACAVEIKCEDFHGKGTIDDYTVLFQAASKIATDASQMKLDIEVDGFNEFGAAADELSNLFINFTKKLESINIIDDTVFLTAVLSALTKIVNLSNIFGRFKETIKVTSEIKIPKSLHDTNIALNEVMSEVNCAMQYINHFVTPDANLVEGALSADDKNIITKAVNTIENWQIMCQHGLSIALVNDTDIISLKTTNTNLKQKTNILKSATDKLRSRLAQINI